MSFGPNRLVVIFCVAAIAACASKPTGLDRDTIRQSMAKNQRHIEACYEDSIAPGGHRENLPEGKITTRFEIEPSGAVIHPRADENTVGSLDLEACVVQALKRFSFPPSGADKSTFVVWPFVFRKGTATSAER